MRRQVLRWMLLIIVMTGSTGVSQTIEDVDLSPVAWPPGELEHYSELQNTNNREHPPARGRRGMVVGTTGALAIRSGIEALRQGGTAVDAALTTALAQITLMAGATVSFAGYVTLVHYEADSGQISYLNSSWNVPRGQASGYDIPPCGTPDGRQVLVHGFMAGLEAAHGRFGELPFEVVFGPAIYFADQGFELFPMLGYWIDYRFDVIARLPGGRAVFTKPDGSRYRIGDWFRQPQLAETLTRVSREGSSYMYSGDWAQRLVSTVRAEGGRLSLADLESYEPAWLEPLRFDLEDLTINSTSSPGVGGSHLRAAMRDLDADVMRSWGHYSESADALAELLEGVERAYGYGAMKEGSHSDAVLAVDTNGNVAALLHTINTNLWGDTGIFVDGVSISDLGCWAQWSITNAGPGGRLETMENPLIVTRGGVPVAATSAVGSGLFPATFFDLTNLLVYGMDPQQAVDTPTFLYPHFTNTSIVHRTTIGEFSAELLDEVRARGHFIQELPPYSDGAHPGWCISITIDPATGIHLGATQEDWNGIAMAEEVQGLWRRPSRRVP